jgi:phenylacetate-CoA ligase
VLVCYSQAVADLARHVVARNLRDWDTIPVICGAERLYPADRAVVEQAFGPAVFETYGCREVMLVATECDAHAGLHMSMETLVVEVVVREAHNGTARPAMPGELGEVVITDLTNPRDALHPLRQRLIWRWRATPAPVRAGGRCHASRPSREGWRRR